MQTIENASKGGLMLDNILKSRSLNDREFVKISAMIYETSRIDLHAGKKELVQARLNKRLRLLGIDTYKEYLKYIEEDKTGKEFITMVDSLTTNLTYFFREPEHFDYLKREILEKKEFQTGDRFRIWSAGCSTGEEAYSIAMLARETLPKLDSIDFRILASDISTRVIAVAREGVYSQQRFRDTPASLRDRYFNVQKGDLGSDIFYQANQELRRLIKFIRLNLMENWPVKGPFDVIFCRNVMIYFDKNTQAELVARYYNMLKPGGVFMIGHSESLTGVEHPFSYVKPSIYIKK